MSKEHCVGAMKETNSSKNKRLGHLSFVKPLASVKCDAVKSYHNESEYMTGTHKTPYSWLASCPKEAYYGNLITQFGKWNFSWLIVRGGSELDPKPPTPKQTYSTIKKYHLPDWVIKFNFWVVCQRTTKLCEEKKTKWNKMHVTGLINGACLSLTCLTKYMLNWFQVKKKQITIRLATMCMAHSCFERKNPPGKQKHTRFPPWSCVQYLLCCWSKNGKVSNLQGNRADESFHSDRELRFTQYPNTLEEKSMSNLDKTIF